MSTVVTQNSGLVLQQEVATEVVTSLQESSTVVQQGSLGLKGETIASAEVVNGILYLTLTDGTVIEVEGNFNTALGADAFREFVQSTPSAEWLIYHDLNKYPSLTVVDSAGDTCEGHVSYPSTNLVIFRSTAPFSGRAYLN